MDQELEELLKDLHVVLKKHNAVLFCEDPDVYIMASGTSDYSDGDCSWDPACSVLTHGVVSERIRRITKGA